MSKDKIYISTDAIGMWSGKRIVEVCYGRIVIQVAAIGYTEEPTEEQMEIANRLKKSLEDAESMWSRTYVDAKDA